jgi:hypothetical protein
VAFPKKVNVLGPDDRDIRTAPCPHASQNFSRRSERLQAE